MIDRQKGTLRPLNQEGVVFEVARGRTGDVPRWRRRKLRLLNVADGFGCVDKIERWKILSLLRADCTCRSWAGFGILFAIDDATKNCQREFRCVLTGAGATIVRTTALTARVRRDDGKQIRRQGQK